MADLEQTMENCHVECRDCLNLIKTDKGGRCYGVHGRVRNIIRYGVMDMAEIFACWERDGAGQKYLEDEIAHFASRLLEAKEMLADYRENGSVALPCPKENEIYSCPARRDVAEGGNSM